MGIRKTTDFPICQYAPSGVGIYESPEHGWIVQFDFDGRSGRIKVVAPEMRGRTAVIKAIRGRTYDMPREEARETIDQMMAHHHVTAREVLPAELRLFLYGQEDETP